MVWREPGNQESRYLNGVLRARNMPELRCQVEARSFQALEQRFKVLDVILKPQEGPY